MKTLIICNSAGHSVLTMSNANDKYSCDITDVADNKIVIGKDLESNKIVTVPSDTSDYKKQQKINELMKKNEAYSNKIELEQVKKANEELNGEVKQQLKTLQLSVNEMYEEIDS